MLFVRLSVPLIDICRRQRAAAASVLHFDPRNEDRAVFLVVRGRRSRWSEITSSVSALAIDRVAILLLHVAYGFTADLTAVVEIGQYVKYAKCNKVAHTRLPSVGFRDASHKPGGRLPLLSATPTVTLATFKRAATSFAAW